MKTKLLAGLILAGSSLFAGPRIAVGIGFGAPAPVVSYGAAYGAYVPPCPGPDYIFVNGYWQLRHPVIERREVIVRHGYDRHDGFRRDDHRR